MNAKLTLTIEESIISKAKLFAEEQSISLSDMIENYLRAITTESDSDIEHLTPLVNTVEGSYELV